jgi:hypothetical protein
MTENRLSGRVDPATRIARLVTVISLCAVMAALIVNAPSLIGYFFAVINWTGTRSHSRAIAWIILTALLTAVLSGRLWVESLEASKKREERRQYLIDSLIVTGPETDHIASSRAGLNERKHPEFFDRLVQITFEYIDSYYKQTQSQANKSFVLCAVAAVVSLGVMVSGVFAMFRSLTTESAAVSAAGVFGEFIAAVFFYLYNRTVLRMSEYHQKLVLTQNIALALRITEQLPEGERSKAQMELIRALSKDINLHLSPTVEADAKQNRSKDLGT